MQRIRLIPSAALLLAIVISLTTGCDNENNFSSDKTPGPPDPSLSAGIKETSTASKTNSPEPSQEAPESSKDSVGTEDKADSNGKNDAVKVVAKPESVTVLVNKQFALPEDYEPDDLVYPDVPFVFKEKIDKRMMREEAAKALEQMFAGAEEDDIYLSGVSAYRSHATQKSLFNRYVKKDGEEKARTYSAVPGHSEHETGLAIDVSGSDSKCAAENCFADSEEAKWLSEHAAEYGFIVRYPNGKESITGYQYEPWHLRYVGTKISKVIAEKSITLEEYFDEISV